MQFIVWGTQFWNLPIFDGSLNCPKAVLNVTLSVFNTVCHPFRDWLEKEVGHDGHDNGTEYSPRKTCRNPTKQGISKDFGDLV